MTPPNFTAYVSRQWTNPRGNPDLTAAGYAPENSIDAGWKAERVFRDTYALVVDR